MEDGEWKTANGIRVYTDKTRMVRGLNTGRLNVGRLNVGRLNTGRLKPRLHRQNPPPRVEE
jgi:hypothetical protein